MIRVALNGSDMVRVALNGSDISVDHHWLMCLTEYI